MRYFFCYACYSCSWETSICKKDFFHFIGRCTECTSNFVSYVKIRCSPKFDKDFPDFRQHLYHEGCLPHLLEENSPQFKQSPRRVQANASNFIDYKRVNIILQLRANLPEARQLTVNIPLIIEPLRAPSAFWIRRGGEWNLSFDCTVLGNGRLVGIIRTPQEQRMAKLSLRLTNNDDKCAICLVTFDGEVWETPCGHFYHQPCIKQWFLISSNCPYCMQDVLFSVL